MRRCRICKKRKFQTVLDMGEQPLVNSLIEEKDLDKTEKTYPLIVEQCENCSLVQVVDHIDSDEIYRKVDYLYFTGDMPKSTHDYFKQYAEDLRQYIGKKDVGNLVVEIGSNDGIMLDHFQDGYRVLGVDPSTNVVIRALKNDIPTVSDGFSPRVATSIRREFGPAKLIYGNNCIAHIDDLLGVVEGVETLLDDDGVFVVECNYWGSMVSQKNYSLIYHDHFSYFTAMDWFKLAPEYGLALFDAEVTPAQGGSLRVFMRKGKAKMTERCTKLLDLEVSSQLNSYVASSKFNMGARSQARTVGELVKALKGAGKTIAGYGAAAKGFSILALAKITDELDYFVDDSPAKQGKYTPIHHIPVISRNEAAEKLPDYFFITAPNYADDIIAKEGEFLKNGGAFILSDGTVIEGEQ